MAQGAWFWTAGARFAALGAALLLGGCLAGFPLPLYGEVEVDRRHALGTGAQGRSFAIEAPAGADHRQVMAVSRRLQQLGFRHVADPGAADLIVTVTARAESFLYEWDKPVFVEVGGGQQRIALKTYGPDGFPQSVSTTVDVPAERRFVGTHRVTAMAFRRVLWLDIRRNGGAGDRVFDGRAVTSGDTPAEAAGADCLVAALFHDFPGRSGKTFTVSYPRGICPAG